MARPTEVARRSRRAAVGPGKGVETAAARLAGLPEDGRVERQQGELEIPGTPTAHCRESVEGREKNG